MCIPELLLDIYESYVTVVFFCLTDLFPIGRYEVRVFHHLEMSPCLLRSAEVVELGSY